MTLFVIILIPAYQVENPILQVVFVPSLLITLPYRINAIFTAGIRSTFKTDEAWVMPLLVFYVHWTFLELGT